VPACQTRHQAREPTTVTNVVACVSHREFVSRTHDARSRVALWNSHMLGKDHRATALWLAPVRRLGAIIAAMAARSTAPPGFSEIAIT
jgi:hypothetical protein